MNKQDLIKKIKDLTDISNDEKAYLIELVNTKKKYGLVWEDKPEDVEEQLRSMLPVFKEVRERAIISDDVNAPNHILIEGDNLHALTALSYTHEGKVDVIYIDPPYNTGNKTSEGKTDFRYNDEFIDKENAFRHSKWLSFMDKRLRLAKKLLSENGVIFISIDDNEQAQLKLISQEIFGDKNFISVLPTVMNLKGNQDEFAFAGTHEYTLVIANNKTNFKPNNLPYDSEELDDWDEDSIGYFKKGATMRATGTESLRENRPFMFYPIFVDKNDNVKAISEDEFSLLYDKDNKIFNDEHLNNLIQSYNQKGYEVVLPMVNNNTYGRWRWGFSKENIKRYEYDIIINRTKNGISLYKKQRPELGNIPSKKPKTIFYKPEYSSGNGTTQLKNIFNDEKVFNNPKPLDLILDFLKIGSNNNSIILDFFAGSGTTLHATMALNAEDGGNRQCILVTNNENQIAEEVTYERNKRVIQGYTNAKGEQVEGLKNNNLRYYQADFVPSERTEVNRRLLTSRSTELLCIKENCFIDKTNDFGINEKQAKIFSNGLGKYMVVVYHTRNQEEVIEQLSNVISGLETSEKVKVYAFSPEKEIIEDDFYKVADKITAVPLPDSIYNAYRATFRTLKLEKKEAVSSTTNQEA